MYSVLEAIRQEIQDKEFSYEDRVYNAASVRALQIFYYAHARSGTTPSPVDFIGEAYEWYKTYPTTRLEQMFWIRNFVEVFDDLSASQARDLMIVYQKEVEELAAQLIALAEVYMQHRDELTEELFYVSHAYETTRYRFIGYSFEEELLTPIVKLARSPIGPLLSESLKESIIQFVLCHFSDTDEAVQIYAALTK